MHPWLLGLIGGVLIGLSAALTHVALQRTAGISGILGGLLTAAPDRGFRLAFLGGLGAVGAALALTAPALVGTTAVPPATLALGGVLVGFGARLGNGCTSGHGVCGLGRRSPRSVLATVTFVGVGMLTVATLRALGGGWS